MTESKFWAEHKKYQQIQKKLTKNLDLDDKLGTFINKNATATSVVVENKDEEIKKKLKDKYNYDNNVFPVLNDYEPIGYV